MFRITKDVWLKRDILEALDNQPYAIYFYELLVDFPQISLSTLQKKCHELQKEVSDCYPNGEVQILIDKRQGIKLIRETDNLQKIIEVLLKKELPYQTAKHFIFTDSIESALLCEQLGFSNSKLRRQLARTNAVINSYDLHMTVSHQVKLFGNEAMRRSLTILILSITHRQFSNVDWIDNSEFYINQALKIAEHLELPPSCSYVESIALISFVNEQAIRRSRPILFHNEVKELIEQIQFPRKPYFLTHWDENDWIFFILTIYGAAFSPFTLEVTESYKETFLKTALYADWIHLFEKNFSTLSEKEKKQVFQDLLREHLTTSILKINYVFFSAHTVKSLKNLEISHPRYFKVFSEFWESFIALHPEFDTSQTKINNLFTCQSLVPIDHYLPEIHLFIDTNLMYSLESLMKRKITQKLSDKYVISFTDKKDEANFIITTYATAKLPYSENVILLEPSLSSNDFALMEKRFDNYYK